MYNLIFKYVANLSIDEYATIFKDRTNIDYKEFLIDQYRNKNISARKISEMLGLSFMVTRTHLATYNIKKKQKESDDSIMVMTPAKIEKETGRPFMDIYNELAAKGMSLTEIAIELKIKSISTLSTYLTKYRQSQIELNEDNFVVKGLIRKQLPTIEKMFLDQLGITFKDWLKQKYIDEKLSPFDIRLLTGINQNTINNYIKGYGLSKTSSQSRQDAINKGRIDYNELNKKGRITRLKNVSRSNKQDLFRELLKHHLLSLIEIYPDIEIVTGYNEYCVLNTLEIDIPVIIIHNNKIYKFALEYDGDIWHEHRKTDKEKENLLNKKNWILLRFEENSSNSNSIEILENATKEIVNNIIEYIKVN